MSQSATETERIADQLSRVCQGPAWHGDSLSETLASVTAAEAAAKPIPEAHGIWELLLHLTAWSRFAWEAIHRREYAVSGEINFPAIADTSEQAWQADLAKFNELNRELVTRIQELPDSRLEEIVPGREYSLYFLLHGIVQHHLYHGGQMALLKKALSRTQRSAARSGDR